MAPNLLFLFTILLAFTYDVVDSRPSNNEYPEAVNQRLPQPREVNTQTYKYDGRKFVKELLKDPNFAVDISPKAVAVTGADSVAISNPISRVILSHGDVAFIDFNPMATAVAGPGGVAIAESELEVLEYVAK